MERERERERERKKEGKDLIPLKLGFNMLETIRKNLIKMLKQKVGVARSKISTLLFSPQVCPVPKDILISHSILTGIDAWHRIERHLATLCFHL